MNRPLNTVENRGTLIRHRRVGTIAEIAGDYNGGFITYVEAECKRFMLPFEEIGFWEVMSETLPRFGSLAYCNLCLCWVADNRGPGEEPTGHCDCPPGAECPSLSERDLQEDP